MLFPLAISKILQWCSLVLHQPAGDNFLIEQIVFLVENDEVQGYADHNVMSVSSKLIPLWDQAEVQDS